MLRSRQDPRGELVRLVGGAAWHAADVWNLTASWARGLDDVARPGSVIVTAADTGPEAIALTAAVSALGAIELPLAPDVPAEWAGRLVEATRAVAIVATDGRAQDQPLLRSLAAAHGVPLIRAGADLPSSHPTAGRLRPRPMLAMDPALVMTTSGTTGRTKAALLPVGAPVGQAHRVSRAMGYTADDVLLTCFAWHHINARHATFLPALISGARMVASPRFSASTFLDVARNEDVTAFNFMGAVCAMLLAQPPRPDDRDHRVRVAYGGPAPAPMVAAFRERFGVTLHQAYACTELGDVAITGPADLCPGAAGRVVDDYEVVIVDDHGAALPEGAVGELMVRPRREGLALLEYVGDPEADRQAWHDDWFRTRDRARVVDGWLWFEGRTGDVIRRRGLNIDPQRVEQALVAHPRVVEAAAVPVPSELTEDEVLAVVVLSEGPAVSADALWEHCRQLLPHHEVPRYLSVEDVLPHNRSLKVDRAALRHRGLTPSAWDADDRHPTHLESP